jgi:hypothetical protein
MNLQFSAKFKFQMNNSNRAGPTCQRVKPALTGKPGYPIPPAHIVWLVTACDRTHHAVVAPVLVAAGERRPTWVCGLIIARGHNRISSSTFHPSHACLALLSSAPGHPPLLAVNGHCRPPTSLSEPGFCSVVTSSSSRMSFKPEPMAIASGSTASSPVASFPMSWLSLRTNRTPPASPPLRGEMHEHVVPLCPHLHR